MSTRRPKVPAYHHGDLRTALLAAAIQVLNREGASSLTLRRVAREAGVSHQAPYHHFADVHALLAAIAEEGFVALRLEIERATKTYEGDDVRRLQRSGVAYVRFAVMHQAHFRIMFGPHFAERKQYPGLNGEASKVFSLLSLLPPPLADTSADAAVFRENDPRVALWSIVHGLAWLIIDRQLAGEPTAARAGKLAEQVTTSLWFGLGGASAE